MRLLLAEDELANAISAVLKHKNYSVDAVYNGIDAYNYAIAQDYDGIILDIMMPGMDGFETLEEIRKENSLPILMFTSKNDSASKVRGLRAGADDYLTKPFDMDELIARIISLIRRYTRSIKQTE